MFGKIDDLSDFALKLDGLVLNKSGNFKLITRRPKIKKELKYITILYEELEPEKYFFYFPIIDYFF